MTTAILFVHATKMTLPVSVKTFYRAMDGEAGIEPGNALMKEVTQFMLKRNFIGL